MMDSNIQGMTELLKRQMQNVEKAQKMKGKKPEIRFPKEILLSQYREELSRSKSSAAQSTYHNSIITLTYAPCTEPLLSLQRIPLSKLVLETVHRGKYVIFRTLVEPEKAVGIRTVVEDPEGNVDVFSLYNYDLDKNYLDVIPNGIIIALKEPYYKLAAGGGAILRCDHPQNAIRLNADDSLVRQLIWKSGEPNLNVESRRKLSYDEHRLEGNNFFTQGKFYDAITTYTRGLASTVSEASIITLRLNRAAALLKVEHYEAALDDCRHVLELNVENEKALYRAAKAFYALEEYEQALIKMQLCAKVATNKEEVRNEIKTIRDRLNEKQRGIYDWNMMVTAAKNSLKPRLNHASYIGPVRVANISNEKGRGLVVTRNVCKGELLLCSKAFQICYPVEASPVIYINMETKLSDNGAQGMLSQKIVNRLINNPSLTRIFFDLYAGKHRLSKIPAITSTSPVIDAFWVGDICTMNAFTVIDNTLNVQENKVMTFRHDHLCDTPSALFLMPSYINHSCLGNCAQSFIGDMMIVRALDDLQVETELLMTYVDTFLGLEERKLALIKHGFICNCRLCELDQAESKELQNQRKVAIEMFESNISLKIKQNPDSQLWERIQEAEKILNNIENTYVESNRNQLQIRLCSPLMVLAKLYFSNGNTEKSIDTCMKILKIHKYGTKENVWTYCLFETMLQLCLAYYAAGQETMGQLWLEKLCAELSITATGDDRIFLEEYRKVLEKYGAKL